MKLHANARLSVKGRELLVDRILMEGWSLAQAAEAAGVTDRTAANQWVQVALATGLGELRNGLIVRAADVLLAVGGAYGTLSEVALALATGVPVVGYDTWSIDGVEPAESPEQAAGLALERAAGGDGGDP